MKGCMMLAAGFAAMTAMADVVTVKDKPVIDGKLDDACWASAQWEKGFHPIRGSKFSNLEDDTEFAIVTDAKAVYVAFRCHESSMAKLKARPYSASVVTSNDIELFFSPSADPQNFYQFCVSAPHNVAVAIYHIEGGMTHPDPYGPDWEHALALGDDEWTVEMAIPLTAFYNTRAEDWRGEWVVNVSRQDLDHSATTAHLTSWSKLDKGFLDPVRFGRLKGFPLLKPEEDVAVNKAVVQITGERDGKLEGEMTVAAYSAKGGAFRFESDHAEARDVTLPAGESTFTAKCAFPKNARYQVALNLVRAADGKRFGRTYPVPVDYDALRVRFTRPAFRTNFYPGQDCSRIEGTVLTGLSDPVTVTLEGPGIPRTEKTVKGGEAFSFETPKFAPGEAKMTFTCGKETRTKTVRKLAANGHRLSWVENGCIVVDGRPVIRRNFYGGGGYRCSKPYMDRISDVKMHLTPETDIRGIEFGRLVKGSEQREGVKDDPPSKEVLDAIDRKMDEYKDKEFCGYYLCDEPECRSISPVYLRYIYNHMIERDPRHLCFICSRDPMRYADCCDVIEPHPYLCPYYDPEGNRVYGTPTSRYGAMFEGLADRLDKVIGNVSFAFSYHEGNPTCDYATFDEYVGTIWAALCEGCRSFWPFIADGVGSTWGLYYGVEYTFAQIEELEPWLLKAKRTRLAKTADYVATKWEMDGETLFAVVNFQPRARRVKLDGFKGAYGEFRGDRVFRSVWGKSEMWIDLGPFETIVASSRPIVSKYPSLRAVRALVEQGEYERTHRDNQIFYRDTEIEAEGSGVKSLHIKAVDGILDQQAYVLRGGNPYLELKFPNEPITFAAIRLFGENLGKAEVKALVGGAWKTLAAKMARKGYEYEFVLDGAVAAEKVRFEFHRDNAEIYEIEFPYVK